MENVATSHNVFVTGLRNAHAMENQALAIIKPQLNRLEHYPEVSELLERHQQETEGQIARLEEILQGVDESPSGLKDAMLSMTGAMGALTHSMAPDEILKNSLANFAFENFEIAAYTSLIAAARLSGATNAIPALEQNLEEERRTAQRIEQMLPLITERFITRQASGVRADV
jgi:ferritin-like metal-binding protein YciE